MIRASDNNRESEMSKYTFVKTRFSFAVCVRPCNERIIVRYLALSCAVRLLADRPETIPRFERQSVFETSWNYSVPLN